MEAVTVMPAAVISGGGTNEQPGEDDHRENEQNSGDDSDPHQAAGEPVWRFVLAL
jgi:hypothetical protein